MLIKRIRLLRIIYFLFVKKGEGRLVESFLPKSSSQKEISILFLREQINALSLQSNTLVTECHFHRHWNLWVLILFKIDKPTRKTNIAAHSGGWFHNGLLIRDVFSTSGIKNQELGSLGLLSQPWSPTR